MRNKIFTYYRMERREDNMGEDIKANKVFDINVGGTL